MDKLVKYLKFILLLIWQLPQSIVGWAMMLFFVIFGKVKLLHYINNTFIFESSLMRGSISLGTVIICCSTHADKPATIQHELGHVKQSKYLGWLYLFVIGIPSIVWASIYRRLGYRNYYHFYTEKWANKLGYVKVINEYDYFYYLEIVKNILIA